MSVDIDQDEAEECYREREQLRSALECMIALAETYSEWAPQWGEYRNQGVAERAMDDLLAEMRKRHPGVTHGRPRESQVSGVRESEHHAPRAHESR